MPGPTTKTLPQTTGAPGGKGPPVFAQVFTPNQRGQNSYFGQQPYLGYPQNPYQYPGGQPGYPSYPQQTYLQQMQVAAAQYAAVQFQNATRGPQFPNGVLVDIFNPNDPNRRNPLFLQHYQNAVTGLSSPNPYLRQAWINSVRQHVMNYNAQYGGNQLANPQIVPPNPLPPPIPKAVQPSVPKVANPPIKATVKVPIKEIDTFNGGGITAKGGAVTTFTKSAYSSQTAPIQSNPIQTTAPIQEARVYIPSYQPLLQEKLRTPQRDRVGDQSSYNYAYKGVPDNIKLALTEPASIKSFNDISREIIRDSRLQGFMLNRLGLTGTASNVEESGQILVVSQKLRTELRLLETHLGNQMRSAGVAESQIQGRVNQIIVSLTQDNFRSSASRLPYGQAEIVQAQNLNYEHLSQLARAPDDNRSAVLDATYVPRIEGCYRQALSSQDRLASALGRLREGNRLHSGMNLGEQTSREVFYLYTNSTWNLNDLDREIGARAKLLNQKSGAAIPSDNKSINLQNPLTQNPLTQNPGMLRVSNTHITNLAMSHILNDRLPSNQGPNFQSHTITLQLRPTRSTYSSSPSIKASGPLAGVETDASFRENLAQMRELNTEFRILASSPLASRCRSELLNADQIWRNARTLAGADTNAIATADLARRAAYESALGEYATECSKIVKRVLNKDLPQSDFQQNLLIGQALNDPRNR